MNDEMLSARGFTGTRTLYGQNFEKFCQAHVYVIGVGGVGSWAAEGLARTGVGEITLVDLDVLVESNINRQLPALASTLGESKIEAMAYRLKQINPNLVLNLVDDFVTPDNIKTILPTKEMVQDALAMGRRIVVLDCVDDMSAKLAIALHCRFNKIRLVVSGGAGGKIDPTQIQVADLKDVSQDPLLAKLRVRLKEKNISQNKKGKFGIKCVYSAEQLKLATVCESGLNCGGYGSAVAVTSVVGMVMVSECLSMIAK
ncbi:tRNA threonylcarbamoyladenosine dehydratase [Moraxella haemolytica]|uniref:tRNA threonylcarbamoyladenosine dehydratase n=1 Tax=Moraxella TaxID=475 RepID=UPI0025434D42|nr:tRNA threonylcarbamoyladenosine dehydratase [Moraxella sp. ZY171148]WII95648.1 tRNA threonylcarbamoyladenosine dehydratase [Moraxella sp. ZY171148]